MKVPIIIPLALTGALCACASMDPRIEAVRAAPEKCKVGIFEVDGNVVVDHEPAHVKNCTQRKVTFMANGNLKFALVNGIRFTTAGPSCSRDNDNKYTCTFGTASGTPLKYDINVVDGGASYHVDPTVFND